MYWLYTAVLAAVVAGYAPAAVYRRLARGVPLHLRARLGYGGGRAVDGRAGWIHAVSVGEAVAAAPLVEALHRAYPALPLVVTTVTETGARLVRERFGHLATHRFFPLDFPGAARRVMAAIDPAFLICLETELWPNVLRAAAARHVPVMIANGRLSDRSFRHYRLVRGLLRPVLDHVRVFAMQSAEDARRILMLGARPERVVVTGNLKHDARPDPAGAVELWQRLLGLAPGQRVWIAGSTHRGEEVAVLEAHRAALTDHPNLALIVAPRHPERVPEVVALAAACGFVALRRSQLPRSASAVAGATRNGAAPVIVLDTVGELAQLYAVADVVFVGGSLIELGGHNMLEAALRRKPVLFGPYTTNFREAASLLVKGGGALVVRDAVSLAVQLRRLLADAGLREQVGRAAFEAAASRHGAVQATLDLVARFLYPGEGR